MQFIKHLTPETLTAVARDLAAARYPSRDNACAALAICNQCVQYGGEFPEHFVAPAQGTKPGWHLIQVPILHEVEQPDPSGEGNTSTGHTATADLGNADQIEE